MRILAIVGSQRKRGNTARLVQMIGSELEVLAGRAGPPLMEIAPGVYCCVPAGDTRRPVRPAARG